VSRDDDEEDIGRHDRPERRADLDVGAARAEEVLGAVGETDCAEENGRREGELAPREEPAEDVVDDPADGEDADARRDRRPRSDVGHAPVDEVRVGVRVVEDDEQREPGEPGRVGLPLEPEEWLRQLLRRDLVLLDVVEAAAVDLPGLAADALLGVPLLLRRAQVVVESDEVERRSDPRDPRDQVQTADEQVEPVGRVGVEGEREHAGAYGSGLSRRRTSSRPRRVRPSRPRPTAPTRARGRLRGPWPRSPRARP